MSRKTILTLATIGVLLILLVMPVLIHRTQGQSKLQSALDDAKRAGFTITFEEQFGAFKQSPKDSSAFYQGPPHYAGNKATSNLYDQLKKSPAEKIDPTDVAEVDNYCNELQQLRKLTDFTPKRDWNKGVAVLFPEYAQIKGAVKALTTRAWFRARNGNPSGAASDFDLAVTISNQPAQEKVLIGQLVGIACDAIVANSAMHLAGERPKDVKLLQSIDTSLSRVKVPVANSSLSTELNFGILTAKMIRNGELDPTMLDLLASRGDTPTPEKGFKEKVRIMKLKWNLDYEEADYIGQMIKMNAAWGDTEKMRAIEGKRDPGSFSSLMMPSLNQIVVAETRAHCYLRSSRIALAATVIRARKGVWPSLEEAARSVGVTTKDPFGSNSLGYVAELGGVTVFSYGPNGVDNRAEKTKSHTVDDVISEIRLSSIR